MNINEAYLFRLGRPFSPIYSLIMRLRGRAYSRGILRSVRLERPVISIGNLSLGGTGKTPHVVYVCRLLKKKGFRPAVITRGYGGQAGKGPLVVSDGSRVLACPEEGGDEAYMLASSLENTPVVAGSDRIAGARLAIDRFGSDVLVLDDGFQHLRVKRDLDVVLFPADAPFGSGRVFPGGDLREPISAIKRADVGLITGLDPRDEIEAGLTSGQASLAKEKIHMIAPSLRLFRSYVQPDEIVLLDQKDGALKGLAPSKSPFEKGPVLLFCAIGAPQRFFDLGGRLFSQIVGRISFRDHYAFRSEDIERLFTKAADAGASALICTEKDWVKIAPLLDLVPARLKGGVRIGFLRITIEVERAFDRMVLDAARGVLARRG